MEFLMLLAMPFVLLGGFALDAATNDDDAPDNTEAEKTDHAPII